MAKKIRSDKKVSELKYKGSIPPQPPLTRERFMGTSHEVRTTFET